MRSLIVTITLVCFGVFLYSCSDSSAAMQAPPRPVVAAVVKSKASAVQPKPSVVKPPAVRRYNTNIKKYLDRVSEAMAVGDANYNWYNDKSCNVGLTAQCVTKLTEVELDRRLRKDYAEYFSVSEDLDTHPDGIQWRGMIKYYCALTGRQMKGVVADLNKVGFTNYDVGCLEFLADPYILYHTDIDATKKDYYAKKENVIKYMVAWSNLIYQQMLADAKKANNG